MIKYVEYNVVFEEIPDRVTLAFTISNCQNKCKGCHSSFLRGDIGKILNKNTIDEIFDKTIRKCNCVLFLGEGNNKADLFSLNQYIKEKYNIETAIYSGRDVVEEDLFNEFDFVKIGSYKEEFGPLNNKNTNQKMFYHKNNITHKFWKEYDRC